VFKGVETFDCTIFTPAIIIVMQKNMTAKEGNWTVGVRGQEFSELKLWNGSP
jgi:hypothetical protein